MNNNRYKNGVTLVEILTVVVIIAILASMVVGIATRLDNKAKEQLAQNTIGIIADALEQFADYEYSYNNVNYSEFKFPLDCNDFTQAQLEAALVSELDPFSSLGVSVSILPDNNPDRRNEYSGSEALYFFLSKVPECRKTLERIDSSLITDEDDGGNQMTIEIDVAGTVKAYPLKRFVDPWLERGKKSRTGRTLRYDYYDEFLFPPNPDTRRAFPVITSAGPDGEFDTSDDITSR